MATVRDLHTNAMLLAQDADEFMSHGDEDQARKLNLAAAEIELTAAEKIERQRENEPTRSILYQNVSALYLHGGDHENAAKFAQEGLSGWPAARTAHELNELLKAASNANTDS